ncbi:Septin-domain-containing protein [Dichotomocladium elegans]|nr:Septin-domain-containing protein [Dichotomocladium elegans]
MVYNTLTDHLMGSSRNNYQRRRKDPIPNLNVMLVGQTGAGKTTFLRTLCEDLKSSVVQGTFKESKPMALTDALQPTEEFYSVSMHLEGPGCGGDDRMALTLIDTPGISHMVPIEDLLQHICKYIDHQLERTFIEETKIRRDPKAIDTHIHACIYFIDTMEWVDGLTDIDRYMLRMLSFRVNIIPVLGKADTLTVVQREYIKKTCRTDLFDIYQIPVYGNIGLDDSDEENEEEEDEEASPTADTPKRMYPSPRAPQVSSTSWGNILEMLHECLDEDPDDQDVAAMIDYLRHMPLCLIGYEEDPETGRPVFIEPTGRPTSFSPLNPTSQRPETVLGRRYPWATVECCNPNHCDFQKFKSLFGPAHMDMLRIDTYERFYEKYRADQLMSRQATKISTLPSQIGR